MTVKINAQGAERKRLVLTIAKWMGDPAEYCGAPTFRYKVGGIIVDKSGDTTFPESLDPETTERLLEHLYDEGFDMDMSAKQTEEAEPTGVCISMPRSLFTEAHIVNLHGIVESKGNLIKKALGVSELPILLEDAKVCFPWFPAWTKPEELVAYEQFICRICDMARNQKRINAKEKEVDNEKYTFRCFLLRLGFIGDEHKISRKILLRNLSGSSAFKAGAAKEVAE